MGEPGGPLQDLLLLAKNITNATQYADPIVIVPPSFSFLSFLIAPILRVIAVLQHPKIRDWVSLIFFGALAELSRRVTMGVWEWVSGQIFITAEFISTEESHDWMLNFWTNHKTWKKQARHFECETQITPGAVKAWPWLRHENPDLFESVFVPQFIPKDGVAHWIKFNGHHVKFMKVGNRESGWRNRENDRLTVSILSRSRKPFTELLLLAKKAYELKDSSKLVIRTLEDPSSGGTWKKTLTRAKRSLESVVAEDGVKERVLKDMKEYVKSQKWYLRRGVPWRRGYLFYGKPGTGKTSSIHAFASELGMEIYVLSLASSGMNDSKLLKAMIQVPPGAMVVIEDVDAALPKRDDKDDGDDEDEEEEETTLPDGTKKKRKKKVKATTQVTLSGVLNALDGIAGGEGRILIMTTNHKDKLDSALIRPGRADLHIEYKLASIAHAKQLFRLFYPSTPVKHDWNSEENKALCEMLDMEDEVLDEEEEKGEGVWDEKEVEGWAGEWAGRIPDREFSIAQLQGMLLLYKSDPAGATQAIEAWVSQELKERADAALGSKETAPVTKPDEAIAVEDAVKAEVNGVGKEDVGVQVIQGVNGVTEEKTNGGVREREE